MEYKLNKEYLKKNGIEVITKPDMVIAKVRSSYTGEVIWVNIDLLAKQKREIIERWMAEHNMQRDLGDEFYDRYPYDVANLAIYGIEVF